MAEVAYSLTCQRCGTAMELRDPAPGAAWAPQQFWVCAHCGRHFWTTYPTATPKKEEPAATAAAPAAKPAGAAAKPAAPAKPPAPAESPAKAAEPAAQGSAS